MCLINSPTEGLARGPTCPQLPHSCPAPGRQPCVRATPTAPHCPDPQAEASSVPTLQLACSSTRPGPAGRGPFPRAQRAGSGRGVPPVLSSGGCEAGGTCPEQSKLGQAETGLVSPPRPPPGHCQRRPLPTHRATRGWEGPGGPGDSSKEAPVPMGGSEVRPRPGRGPDTGSGVPRPAKREVRAPRGRGLNARASGAFRAQLVNPQAY